MPILTLFIFGLFVGSFLNVLIYRVPLGQQWLSGRSYCPHCKHNLLWYDLIPILSWIWLNGKCRYCHKQISWQYPTVELANALLWAGTGTYIVRCQLSDLSCQLSSFGSLGLSGWQFINTILILTLASSLLTLFVIDLYHYIIPDQLIIVLISIGIALGLTEIVNGNWSDITSRLLWGTGAFAFFYLLHFITKGKGMGFGDVKLVFALGLILKSSVVVALMSAFFVGAVIGVGLLASKIRKLKQPIPFGPFLVLGTGIAIVYGQYIIDWYLGGLL